MSMMGKKQDNKLSKEFTSIRGEIKKIIDKSPIPVDPSHSKQVREFVLQIDPNASEELQIAALAHDIDRSVAPRTAQKPEEPYPKYKQRHALRSAKIMVDLMSKHGYSAKSITRVFKLIKNHEVGGDRETDILRDADSASYFANNIDFYLNKHGEKKTKEKITFMYDRASDRTKDLVKKMKFSKGADKLMKDLIK